MKAMFCIFFSGLFLAGITQPAQYRRSNIHAHNDYDHNLPFTEAYAAGTGSIEADVLLINDTLFVAHSRKEIKRDVLFMASYLKPLAEGVARNKGYAYPDKKAVLQLLIDIKTDSVQTLDAVIKAIRQFPVLINNSSVRFVVSGNQPEANRFSSYPSFIFFDGKISDEGHLQQLPKIGLFSADFSAYSKWKGRGEISEQDKNRIRAAIEKAHALKRPFRFWGVPDGPEAWQLMMQLGVDFLNTDHIHQLAAFLEKPARSF